MGFISIAKLLVLKTQAKQTFGLLRTAINTQAGLKILTVWVRIPPPLLNDT
jgi:hypothetical protein